MRISTAIRRLINHKKLNRSILKWRIYTNGEIVKEKTIKETTLRLKLIREESEKQFALENSQEIANMIRKFKEEAEVVKKNHVKKIIIMKLLDLYYIYIYIYKYVYIKQNKI